MEGVEARMNNEELIAAGWHELTLTTDPYTRWASKGFPSSSHWAHAKAYFDQVVDVPIEPPPPPPPPPVSTRTFAFRALFDINKGSYPAAFKAMGFNAQEVYQGPSSPSYALVKALDGLQAGDTGWVWMSGYTPSTTGGSFKLSDAQLIAALTATSPISGVTAANHPKNSHRYVLADDTNLVALSSYTLDQEKLCLAKIADRCALIHQYDPKAICSVVEWHHGRISMFSDATIGRKIVDEMWLDGYANNDAAHGGYLTTRIKDQAAWADAINKQYVIVLSCHEYGGQPAYPTPAQFHQQMEDAKGTNAVGVGLYAWDDFGTDKQLKNDPTMQSAIGTEMAAVTP
jgi:hypothetical protein